MNLFEDAVDPSTKILNMNDHWEDLEFEVALDSGLIVHIASEMDTPGYHLRESEGSRRKQNFVVGDGGELPNLGEKCLRLETEAENQLEATFQVAKVTRPLMSAGLICDRGYEIFMNDVKAEVRTTQGRVVLTFHRRNKGLYKAVLKLKAPFGGRG